VKHDKYGLVFDLCAAGDCSVCVHHICVLLLQSVPGDTSQAGQ